MIPPVSCAFRTSSAERRQAGMPGMPGTLAALATLGKAGAPEMRTRQSDHPAAAPCTEHVAWSGAVELGGRLPGNRRQHAAYVVVQLRRVQPVEDNHVVQ